jgi:hypothetical protein
MQILQQVITIVCKDGSTKQPTKSDSSILWSQVLSDIAKKEGVTILTFSKVK